MNSNNTINQTDEGYRLNLEGPKAFDGTPLELINDNGDTVFNYSLLRASFANKYHEDRSNYIAKKETPYNISFARRNSVVGIISDDIKSVFNDK